MRNISQYINEFVSSGRNTRNRIGFEKFSNKLEKYIRNMECVDGYKIPRKSDLGTKNNRVSIELSKEDIHCVFDTIYMYEDGFIIRDVNGNNEYAILLAYNDEEDFNVYCDISGLDIVDMEYDTEYGSAILFAYTDNNAKEISLMCNDL